MSTFLTRLLERSVAPRNVVRPIIQPFTVPERGGAEDFDITDVRTSGSSPAGLTSPHEDVASVEVRPTSSVPRERSVTRRVDNAVRGERLPVEDEEPEVVAGLAHSIRSLEEPIELPVSPQAGQHRGSDESDSARLIPTPPRFSAPLPAGTIEQVTRSILSRDVPTGIVSRRRPAANEGLRIAEVREDPAPATQAVEQRTLSHPTPAAPTPPVRVSIGRIEVHVEQAPRQEEMPARPRPAPSVSLSDYLQRQRRAAR